MRHCHSVLGERKDMVSHGKSHFSLDFLLPCASLRGLSSHDKSFCFRLLRPVFGFTKTLSGTCAAEIKDHLDTSLLLLTFMAHVGTSPRKATKGFKHQGGCVATCLDEKSRSRLVIYLVCLYNGSHLVGLTLSLNDGDCLLLNHPAQPASLAVQIKCIRNPITLAVELWTWTSQWGWGVTRAWQWRVSRPGCISQIGFFMKWCWLDTETNTDMFSYLQSTFMSTVFPGSASLSLSTWRTPVHPSRCELCGPFPTVLLSRESVAPSSVFLQ